MRFLINFLIVIFLTSQAGAQTVEETAAAAANAAFGVVQERLISEFFKSTGLEPNELEVLGDIVDIITGEDSATDADSDGNGNAKGRGNGRNKKGNSGLPPGLAKRDELPPGLARQLERNGSLPPGLQLSALPPALARQLPNPGMGRKRVVAGDDILLIDTQTGRILDILKDVITGTGN